MQNNRNIKVINRLKWACRRGMLELDLLLMAFLRDKFSEISEKQQTEFERLLTYEDQNLYHWLVNGDPPPEAFIEIIEMIIRHARS